MLLLKKSEIRLVKDLLNQTVKEKYDFDIKTTHSISLLENASRTTELYITSFSFIYLYNKTNTDLFYTVRIYRSIGNNFVNFTSSIPSESREVASYYQLKYLELFKENYLRDYDIEAKSINKKIGNSRREDTYSLHVKSLHKRT